VLHGLLAHVDGGARELDGGPLHALAVVAHEAPGEARILRSAAVHGDVTIGGELKLPTGDEAKGFGDGSSVLEGFALWGKLLRDDSFVQLQGAAEFPRDAALENEISIRAAYGRTWTVDKPFGRARTPMIEVLGAKPLEPLHGARVLSALGLVRRRGSATAGLDPAAIKALFRSLALG
jgi:hypothetical protein